MSNLSRHTDLCELGTSFLIKEIRLGQNPNSRYKKYKKSAHMTCLTNKITQISLEWSLFITQIPFEIGTKLLLVTLLSLLCIGFIGLVS
jgi:hypothetical protein